MMDWLRKSLCRCLSFFRNARLDRDFDAEIAAHLEIAIEEVFSAACFPPKFAARP